MIELKKCCSVPFPKKLFEQYEVRSTCIYANVNASKVTAMMERFIMEHSDEPMFFILEIPTSLDDEKTSDEQIIDSLHEDVYFIDGLNKDEALQILKELGDLLSQDGMNTFGFGGHKSHEEIVFGRYNVMTIFTKDTDKHSSLLNDFGIEKTDNLITAWDTFSREHGGQTWCLESDDMSIYDIPEKYKDIGMYFYERRNKYHNDIEIE